MHEILYRCPDGHEEGFKVDVVVQGTEYIDASGEVWDTKLYDSDIVGPVLCLTCGKQVIEED